MTPEAMEEYRKIANEKKNFKFLSKKRQKELIEKYGPRDTWDNFDVPKFLIKGQKR